MKKKLNVVNLVYTLLMATMFAVCLVPMFGLMGLIPAVGIIVYAAISSANVFEGGEARNEVLKQLFTADLQEALYPDNSFHAGAQTDTAGVDTEKIIIPQDEDGEVETEVNPTILPLPAHISEDKRKEYSADLLITRPEIITYNNQLLTTYDKRAAKLRKHQNSLEKQMAERILYGWNPTLESKIFLSTGAGTQKASAPGATGLRKIYTEGDFEGVKVEFDALDVPIDERRKMLVPAHLLPMLVKIKKEYGGGTDSNNQLLAKGAVMEFFSFQVFVRSKGQIYTEAISPSKKALGSVPAATDNQSILFWHDSFVRKVKGTTKVAMDPYDVPGLAHGRSFNALVRGGGTTSRLSEIGVAVLVEDNA